MSLSTKARRHVERPPLHCLFFAIRFFAAIAFAVYCQEYKHRLRRHTAVYSEMSATVATRHAFSRCLIVSYIFFRRCC